MRQEQRPGRPPKYVEFEGETIFGLSGPKAPTLRDGRFYSTHNDPKTGKREYFGTDLSRAVILFKLWVNRKNIWW